MGITYAEVEKAARELQSQRKSVTGDNIREAIGSGSKSTITKYLRQWKTNHGVNTINESSIPQHLLQIVRDLWNQIESDADDKITEHKDSLNHEFSDTKALLDAAKMENEALKDKCNALQDHLSQSQISYQTLKTDFDDLQKNHAILQEKFSSLESHNGEYKKEISRVHQLLKESQEQVAAHHNKLIEERQSHSDALHVLRSEMESKLSEMRAELNKSNIENTSLQSSVSHLTKHNQQLQADVKSIHENNAVILKQHNELESQNGLLISKLETEKESASILQEKLSELNQDKIDITVSLKTAKNIVQSLQATIASLENKLNLSDSRYHQILQEKMTLEFALKNKTESTVN